MARLSPNLIKEILDVADTYAAQEKARLDSLPCPRPTDDQCGLPVREVSCPERPRRASKLTEREVARLVGQAFNDGFMRGIGRQPWEDMYDWLALTSQEYVRKTLTKTKE